MKQRGLSLAAWGMAAAVLLLAPVRGQDAGAYFRVVSPAPTFITAFSSDGTMVWSNAAVGITGHVQRATTLMAPSNWLDFAEQAVTVTVMTLRLFYPRPPIGMVLIPAGSNSGTNPLASGEIYYPGFYPSNYALAVSSFYMDLFEVSKAQWFAVYNWATNNGYAFANTAAGAATNHPIEAVNWYDCIKWCNARSQKEGRTPAYYTDSAKSTVYKSGQTNIEDNCVNWSGGYRLPTEVEWEYAARGGLSSKRFPWGDTIDHDKANYYGQPSDYDLGYAGYDLRYSTGAMPYTSPAGSFAPNGYGLYDMAGNGWEWCWDWHPDYVGSDRILRGGGWDAYAYGCRVANRFHNSPFGTASFSNDVGFRAVLPAGQ